MKRPLFFAAIIISHLAGAQTLRCVPSVNIMFSGIAKCKDYNRNELYPHIQHLDYHFGIDLNYRREKLTHTLTFQGFPMALSFRLVNKFMLPPNDSLLGIASVGHSASIDCIYIGYSIHRSGTKVYSISQRTKFKMFYEAGLGAAINKNRSYYKVEFSTFGAAWSDNRSYMQFIYTPDRMGHSAIARLCGGIECYRTKRNKSFLIVKVFYNQGFNTMTQFNLSYEYGYFNDPSKQVRVDNIKIKNKGTIWGISIGYPITIKK